MCDITDKKSNRRTGYKVLAHKEEKFYSTFTGQEISVGQVSKAPRRCKRLWDYWNSNLDYNLLKTFLFYNPLIDGKLFVFNFKKDCKEFIKGGIRATNKVFYDYKLVTVKIIFDGETIVGSYDLCPGIFGSIIKSIEIVKV